MNLGKSEKQKATVNRLSSGLTIEQLETLRSLIRKFNDMQVARIAFEARIRAIKGETCPEGNIGFIYEGTIVEGIEREVSYRGKTKKVLGLKSYEDEILKQMEEIAKGDRLWVEWFSLVTGIGLPTASRIIAELEPYWAGMTVKIFKKGDETPRLVKLYPFKARSSLEKMCGMGVNDLCPFCNGQVQINDKNLFYCGKCEKEIAFDEIVGKSVGKNRYIKGLMGKGPRFKAFWFNIAESINKQGGIYKELLDFFRESYEKNYPNWLEKKYGARTREEVKKLHPKEFIPSYWDLARRKFIKIFISHVWEEYQRIYGLEITPPMHWRDQPLSKDQWLHPLRDNDPKSRENLERYKKAIFCEPTSR